MTTSAGAVAAVSMGTGLAAAVVLVTGPLLPARENVLVGAVLLSFALGWTLWAAWSVRFTDQPQRWTAGLALFLGLVGIGCLTGSDSTHEVLSWVWPPALLGLVVWSVLRARRQLRSWSRRWLLYPVLAVYALAAVGGGYETVRETLDARAYPPPGQLIDVGGHRLHLNCTGSGTPVVVLEPGLGAASSDFGWIAPAVARDTTVCVYDRAGRGWSDAVDHPQDAAVIAADLHTLLERAGVPGPYVLAGHSFGGLYVQTYAARYPDEVAGLVLLDSTAPHPGPARPGEPEPPSVVDRVFALLPAAAHLGAGRLLAQSAYDDSLPPRVRDEARANASTARHLRGYIDEFESGSLSIQQAAELTDLHEKPLIVLTADTGHDTSWLAEQVTMAALSRNSLHRTASSTTHLSMLHDQTDSAAATQAIRVVVASVRTARPVPRQ